MSTFDARKKHIRKILEIAIRNNGFEDYLLIMPCYCIENRNLNGVVEPNRYFTMEGIYDYYRDHPQSHIDELMYTTLCSIAAKYKGESAVLDVLETVEYQLIGEERNNAPFTIDCQSVLNELQTTLLKNKEMYMTPKQSFNYIPFWKTLEEYDLKFREKYGLSVL